MPAAVRMGVAMLYGLDNSTLVPRPAVFGSSYASTVGAGPAVVLSYAWLGYGKNSVGVPTAIRLASSTGELLS